MKKNAVVVDEKKKVEGNEKKPKRLIIIDNLKDGRSLKDTEKDVYKRGRKKNLSPPSPPPPPPSIKTKKKKKYRKI